MSLTKTVKRRPKIYPYGTPRSILHNLQKLLFTFTPLKLVRQIALDNFAALKENPYTFSLASYRALSFIT